MAAGLGILRLEPKSFWSMTPRELEAALSGIYGRADVHEPPGRRDLSALMARFPDDALKRT